MKRFVISLSLRAPLATTALLALVAFTALGGCSFGFGSAYVGQWKAQRQVDFEACLREPAGPSASGPTSDGTDSAACKDRKEVVTELPARRFWAVLLPMLQLGVSTVSFGEDSFTRLRFQPNLEYLRGRGRWAYGVRAGGIIDSEVGNYEDADGDGENDLPTDSMGALDVTAIGRLSILDRVSAHAGLGYLPYASTRDERTSLGGRGLLGVQLALNKVHTETRFVLTLELDHVTLRFDDATYRSTGLTGHLGIFF